MAGKKSRAKELYWQDLLNRQAESGSSIREFCARAGVSEPSFYGWRKRLQSQAGRSSRVSKRNASIQDDGPPAANGREFIALELIEAGPALEVIHPRGYRVRVNGRFDATELGRLLDVLDGRPKR